MLPADNDGTQAVALGDVDGDGDLDAYVGNSGDRDRLYLNRGTDGFTDVTGANLPLQFDSTQAVALGDVDADGDLDAFVGNAFPESRLYLNNGTGTFADVGETNLPALVAPTRAVALGDVDGDGDLDAFLGNGDISGQQDLLYLNSGTGVFTDGTATNLPAVLDNTFAVALGDVDGDGDLDAFVGNGGQNRLHLNSGAGTFTEATATNLPALFTLTQGVALGDVDGDGDIDAFLGNGAPFEGAQNRLYLNGGTGVFTDVTATNVPALVDTTMAVALGDVDGDGDLDAFVGKGPLFGALQQNRLNLNDGTGVFADVTATNLPVLLDRTLAVALGDVDGDGDLDAIVGNELQQNRLYLNAGTGVFADVTATAVPGLLDNTFAVVLGDVDGDGDLDAFVGNAGQQNRLHLNGGTGFFADVTATNLPALLSLTRAAALGDVDGDGDLDLFVGNGGQDRLYLNAGSGVFTDGTATHLPALLDDTSAVALGDVDGDGDLDAFTGNVGSCGAFGCAGAQSRLYRNGGTGVFTDVTATSLPALLGVTRAVALGDVDGDGDLDAYLGNGGPLGPPEQNRLYLNGGTGLFTDVTAPNLPLLFDITNGVALGDVDGDGDLDAFVGNTPTFPGVASRLHLNDGTGVFTDVTATNVPTLLSPAVVALGDVEEDGDLDAFVGIDTLGAGGDQNRFFLNGGTGVFTDVTATGLPALSGSTRAVALGDVDGDGDVDGFVGNGLSSLGQQNRLYTNLVRQLAWRGIPRVGKPLALEIHGPSWGAWFLGFSLGTATVPIPPLGMLRLDPASLGLALGGLLDAQGRATFTSFVPDSPALVGLTVYWQAVVAGPARFTNLEVTTFTSL
jgi:hypothetical protein